MGTYGNPLIQNCKTFACTSTDDGYWRNETNQEINYILTGKTVIGFIKKQR